MEYLRRKDVLEAFEPLRPWGYDLRDLRERIKQLPAVDINESLGVVRCPVCREPLDVVVNYCPFCGEQLRVNIGTFI